MVFRVVKNKDYTTISNIPLKDKRLGQLGSMEPGRCNRPYSNGHMHNLQQGNCPRRHRHIRSSQLG